MFHFSFSRSISAALFAALVTAAAAWAWATANARLSGKVSSGGAPLAGATVKLSGAEPRQVLTASDGTFELASLRAGDYAIVVSAPAHTPHRGKFSLAAGESKSLSIGLSPAAESLAEEAVDAPPAKNKTGAELAKKDSGMLGGLGTSATGASATRTREARMDSAKPRPPRISPPATAAAPPAPPPPPHFAPLPIATPEPETSTEAYQRHAPNQWTNAATDALSTFAVDVDTGSYTIVRRKLAAETLPPPEAVRVEEIVNYFRYDYAPPKSGPFQVYLESAPSPFEPKLDLLRVALKGELPAAAARPPVRLTFLVDTSGSMSSEDKLGLVKRSLRFLVDNLSDGDTVALATYAGSVRQVLAPTGMHRRAEIHAAIEDLSAGGSTAMASGLQLAYQLAASDLAPGTVSRVIVCSDGDANVGSTAHGDMLSSIAHFVKQGVTLSTIGFGMGNYKDTTMEQLANNGNGNYYYIDDFSAARRIFGEQLLGTLQVIARDVKIQVEFDPKVVKKYRLVGYENRDIADQDFRNDKVDAGEVGAGHAVTALYEVEVEDRAANWATVRVRWKKPGHTVVAGDDQGEVASELGFPLSEGKRHAQFGTTSPSFRRAVAAAAWAENLRKSPFVESWTMKAALELAESALEQESPEELELLALMRTTAALMAK